MKTHPSRQFAGLCLLVSALSAHGQSAAWWSAYKQQHGLPPGLIYNDWCAQGCPQGSAPAATVNPQQQMMMNTANAVGQQIGQQIGQQLGNWLFGGGNNNNSGPSQAELEAQRQQQEAALQQAEQQRQQQRIQELARRFNMATQMRAGWDGREQAMSSELTGVFDQPVSGSTDFFGSSGGVNPAGLNALNNDTSVVDLRDDARLGLPAIDTPPSAPATADATAAADPDGAVVLSSDTVDPNFLAAEQTRAAQTTAYNDSLWRWNEMPATSGPNTGGGTIQALQNQAAGWANEKLKAIGWDQAQPYLSELPGYSVFKYAKGALKTAQGDYNVLNGQASKILLMDEENITQAADALGHNNGDDIGMADKVMENFQRRADQSQDAYLKLAGDKAGAGLSSRMTADGLLGKGPYGTAFGEHSMFFPDTTPDKAWQKPLVVPLATTQAQLGYSPWSQQQYHVNLNEVGYGF